MICNEEKEQKLTRRGKIKPAEKRNYARLPQY
jgi:hypothetical protein